MAARARVTRLLGVDGDEDRNEVNYHYGVFYTDDESDYPEPIREFTRVVKV